jgi:plasmid stability protein
MAKTTVELPEVLHRKLRVKAAIENCSMNDIVVAALKGYLHNFRLEPGMLEVESIPRDHHGSPAVPKEV